MKLDVLAIAAHPDDIELACAGTVALLTQSGKKVGILDLTQGELGTRGSKEIRKKEAEASSKILHLSMRVNLKIPDGGIEVNKTNTIKVVQILRHYQPEVLLFPHWLERHPDHEHAHRLAKEAWFYSGLEKIKTKTNGKTQEPFRPKRYFHFMQKYEFQPSFIVDVSPIYHIKQETLEAFSSQFYNPKSKERETMLTSKLFLESIYARDKHFGSLINTAYGEPFYSIEPVGLNSLFDMKL
ncbi:MAG: bacillithiol biosynthesis deacetylase BshB1 [Bacteroidetes bacterium]|nr:bacillithiol biosynthesis deacetylase BshB1 [Bacteroidota bacterium]